MKILDGFYSECCHNLGICDYFNNFNIAFQILGIRLYKDQKFKHK